MRDPTRLLPLLLAAGCTQGRSPFVGDLAGGLPPAVEDMAMAVTAPTGDLAQPFMGAVYAHSASDLYEIDPNTLAISHVGAFDFDGNDDQMTDIAIDKDGKMVGVSFAAVYSIDPATAKCKQLSSLGQQFNGLSYVPVDQIDQGQSGAENLVAASTDGSVWQIDPMTGKSKPLGNYGGNWGSSGDIVAVEGLGALATLTMGGGDTDRLARIDFSALSHANVVGDTAANELWGLGFWGDRVFAFSQGGQFYTIDVKTGKAHLVQSTGIEWWGAAVSTSAPVTIQ